jgi:hypothetical protein
MASEFQSICDDLGHATLAVEDAKALIQPAWFLAQQAAKEFADTPVTILPQAIKTELAVIIDALELNLATLADKKPSATVDFYQFKDVCHLAQLAWVITEPLAKASETVAQSRDLLADASARIKTRMERIEAPTIATSTVLLWTSAIGFGLYLVRRLKRKQMET